MSVQLYFDECCSKRFETDLSAFFAADFRNLKVLHVLDSYDPGTGDSTWLKPLQENPDIIVVTADVGRNYSKEKLPLLCQNLRITHIVFGAALINAGYTKQKTAIAGKRRSAHGDHLDTNQVGFKVFEGLNLGQRNNQSLD